MRLIVTLPRTVNIQVTAHRGERQIVDKIELADETGVAEPASIDGTHTVSSALDAAERQEQVCRQTHLRVLDGVPYRREAHGHERVGAESLVENCRSRGRGAEIRRVYQRRIIGIEQQHTTIHFGCICNIEAVHLCDTEPSIICCKARALW